MWCEDVGIILKIGGIKMGLKSLEEYENEREKREERARRDRNKTGIACPECGSELLFVDPGVVLLTSPPQKGVKCSQCDFFTSIFV